MRDIRVSAAQFEHRDADKAYNLRRIDELARCAAGDESELVAFHECCLTGYTFLQSLSRADLAELAEPIPDGPSVRRLCGIARRHRLVVGAGLIEVEQDRLYNSYVLVGPEGHLATHRKLHPFIHPELSAGQNYCVTDVAGIRVGILTCYDNNLPENVRATTLLGAQLILMPHVTGCLPSSMPGRGTVDRGLWDNRHRDPSRLRMEFQGPKGRGWLMRWLPARAWENGVYVVFSNPIGIDFDTIKPGLAMVLDPHGEVVTESSRLDDDVVTALVVAEAFQAASGRRYVAARRPELYQPLVAPHPPGHRPVTRPGWELDRPPRAGPTQPASGPRP